MKSLTEEQKNKKEHYYIGKTRYFLRGCDFCGIIYKGQGAYFCSYSCSRKAAPIIMRGKESPSWNGGKPICEICNENEIAYNARFCNICRSQKKHIKPNEKKHLCQFYRKWMFGVKNRDSWRCKIADEYCNGRLEAHHILNWVDYPELRYKINNGITLCQAHHPRGRAKEERLIPFFKELLSETRE